MALLFGNLFKQEGSKNACTALKFGITYRRQGDIKGNRNAFLFNGTTTWIKPNVKLGYLEMLRV